MSVGDSLLPGTEKKIIWRRDRQNKVRYFLGVTIDDMYENVKQLLKKSPDNMIIHVGTNMIVKEPSTIVLDSSIVNEAIRTNSRQFQFFLRRDFK